MQGMGRRELESDVWQRANSNQLLTFANITAWTIGAQEELFGMAVSSAKIGHSYQLPHRFAATELVSHVRQRPRRRF